MQKNGEMDFEASQDREQWVEIVGAAVDTNWLYSMDCQNQNQMKLAVSSTAA